MTVGPGDVVELTRLAIDLYNKGYLVIRAAPETFRRLLNDLLIVRNILYRIQLRLSHSRRDASSTPTIDAAVFACREALFRFKPLVDKYKKLGSSDRSSRFRRLYFPFDENKIQACKADLQHATATLNLVLTAEAALGPIDSPVVDFDRSRNTVAERPELCHQPDSAASTPSLSEPRRLLEHHSPSPGPFPTLGRVHTLDSQYELEPALPALSSTPPRSAPAQHLLRNMHSEGLKSVSEHSVTHSPLPLRPKPRTELSTSTSTGYSSTGSSRDAVVSEDARSHHSSSSMTSIGSLSPLPKPVERAGPRRRRPSSSASVRPNGLFFLANDEEQSEDPDPDLKLECPHRHEIVRKLSSDARFQQLDPELQRRASALLDELSLTNWLNCAVWWLLKSRHITRLLGTDTGGRKLSRNEWPVRVSKEQATADYFKACWILRNVVLSQKNLGRPVPSTSWKTFQDLASELLDDLLVKEKLSDLSYNVEQVLNQNLSFTETLSQAVEQPSKVPAALDNLEPPSRWYTIDDDDAGNSRERVLYRTFVNAAIGRHDERRKTIEAPYMFVLWSQHGRSEVLASLINQCGTVNLCATLTREDLVRHDEHTHSDLELELSFPSQEATVIRFLAPDDLKHVLDIPRKFFQDLKEREAHQDEVLIFREGLSSFSHIDSNKKKQGRQNREGVTQAHSSCEVSLYGKIPNECWKTERRLVISSSLDAPTPWCRSFWLPLGDINVFRNQREITLSWSDCCQLETAPDGQFGHYYSYVYNPDRPNNTMNVQFESEDAANEFAADILRPWVWPFEMKNLHHIAIYGSLSADDIMEKIPPSGKEIRVWSVRDVEDSEPAEYLSVVSTEQRPNGAFATSVFFLHRDVDFAIEASEPYSVHFPSLYVPHYRSNINKYRRPPSEEPVFEDAVWARMGETFHFADESAMRSFLHDLTKWEVKFYCRAQSVEIKRGLYQSTKQKDVIVSLWENPAKKGHFTGEYRLLLRWMGQPLKSEDPVWTTLRIASSCDYSDNAHKSQMVFRKANVCFGSELDMKTLDAGDGGAMTRAKTDRQVTLTLPDSNMTRMLRSRIDRCLNPPLDEADLKLPYRATGHSASDGDSRSSVQLFRFPPHRVL